MPMMASSDIDRASKAMDPPRSAEAIARELRFCPTMYSIALSNTAPAWLRLAGDSLGSSGMGSFLRRRFGGGCHRPDGEHSACSLRWQRRQGVALKLIR